MKILFYHPQEKPAEAKIKSTILGIDIITKNTVQLDEMYKLVRMPYFEEIKVNLTEHNEAYYRDTQNGYKVTPIKGWIDLSKFHKGGNYFKDKYKSKEISKQIKQTILDQKAKEYLKPTAKPE